MSFQIVRDDIARQQVEAIVEAGTGAMGFGEAEITKERDRYIIRMTEHVRKDEGHVDEDVIRNCYRSVFSVAEKNGIESIAVPLFAAENNVIPKDAALRIALSETEEFLAGHDMEIRLVVPDDEGSSLQPGRYADIDRYIDDNFVKEQPVVSAYIEEDADRDSLEGGRRLLSGAPSFPKEVTKKPSRLDLFKNRKSRKEAAGTAGAHADFMAARAMEAHEDSAAMQFGILREPAAARSLEDVVGNLDKTFMELVFSFADERGMTDVEVQKKANLDRKAFSKLKCGTTKNPSKATALALAVALRLNLDETKDLLSRAGFALSPCSKQDVIVKYFIEHEAYDIYEINLALFEHGEGTLGAGA